MIYPILLTLRTHESLPKQTLDSTADGYGRGEGLAAVTLCGISNADPCSLLCILCGVTVNQDGRSSALTAPNGAAPLRCCLCDWEGGAPLFLLGELGGKIMLVMGKLESLRRSPHVAAGRSGQNWTGATTRPS